MKRLFWVIALLGAARAAEAPVPKFQLDKNAIEVAVESKSSPLLVCTARLTFPGKDDLPGVSSESYLIQYDSEYPIIVDKIDGFAVTLEMCDVSGDGQRELVAFFSAGANNYGVKVFRVTKTRYRPKLYPLLDPPVLSNMHSIKIEDGEIRVEVQNRLSVEKAEIETIRYKLDGDSIKLVGKSKRIVGAKP